MLAQESHFDNSSNTFGGLEIETNKLEGNINEGYESARCNRYSDQCHVLIKLVDLRVTEKRL